MGSPALDGYRCTPFTALGQTRDVYRTGSGPAVIVISEIPGITPNVADFGRRVAGIGCTAVLPRVFGTPGRPASPGYALKTMSAACVSREFSAFALRRTSPITVWLRALARSGHQECGGPGVGVVGMCFTGGFALAMMVDDTVLAPVLSQPSLPFPVTRSHRRDLGVSDHDLQRAKQRAAEGSASSACASPTTASCPPNASSAYGKSWGTPSWPWRSTPPRATPTATLA